MKYLASILAFIAALYTGSLCAKDFTEGKDYFALGNAVSKSQKITEYFSFYCPACFRQEPFMKSIKAELVKPGAFVKNHVTNMPGRDEEAEMLLSQALITGRLLNLEEKITDKIFNYLHVARKHVNSVADIKPWFIELGIDGERFDKTFASFKVKMEAKRMAANTEKLRSKGFSAVPTLVVNDNFVPNTKSLKSMAEYKELIKHLLTLTQ